jgi:hypothetical protein
MAHGNAKDPAPMDALAKLKKVSVALHNEIDRAPSRRMAVGLA